MATKIVRVNASSEDNARTILAHALAGDSRTQGWKVKSARRLATLSPFSMVLVAETVPPGRGLTTYNCTITKA